MRSPVPLVRHDIQRDPPPADEMKAFQAELEECIRRRFGGDPHRDAVATAVGATAIVLAKLIKRGGQDEQHRAKLRFIAKSMLDATT